MAAHDGKTGDEMTQEVRRDFNFGYRLESRDDGELVSGVDYIFQLLDQNPAHTLECGNQRNFD